MTYQTAYTLFTPNKSEQRLHPPYYRGCWHGVSRCFLQWYHQSFRLLTESIFSHLTELYDPKVFITHAALLRQGFPHSQNSSLLPPVGVWTVFQFQCG